MSIREISGRKSVSQAPTLSCVPLADACAATFQHARTAAGLIRSGASDSVLKNFPKKPSRNAMRFAAIAFRVASKPLCSSPPGLSAVRSRNGVIAEMKQARLTRSVPYLPR